MRIKVIQYAKDGDPPKERVFETRHYTVGVHTPDGINVKKKGFPPGVEIRLSNKTSVCIPYDGDELIEESNTGMTLRRFTLDDCYPKDVDGNYILDHPNLDQEKMTRCRAKMEANNE